MDPLAPLLERFRLQTDVFHTGELCTSVAFPEDAGVGYIHCLETGSLELVMNNGVSRIIRAPATIFYSRPSTHQLTPVPGTDTSNLVCGSIKFGVGGHSVLCLGLPDAVLLTETQVKSLAPLLALLFRESAEESAAKKDAINRLCELLVIHLLRYLMADGQVDCSLLSGLADPHLSRLLTELHKSPEQSWTLDTMAQLCGMSRAPFARRFREVIGVPPAEYLAHWRLSVVQDLLLMGVSVTAAALEVGYESPSAMARAFRRRYGVSPTDWVRNIEMNR